MKKVQGNKVAMIEVLESRRLLSASASTIAADVSKLQTDLATLKSAVKTAVTDLVADVKVGVAGRKPFRKDLNELKAEGNKVATTLSADLATVQADVGMAGEAAALEKLATDAKSARVGLKADTTAIKDVVKRHGSLVVSAKLIADKAAVNSAYAAVKADGAKLKTDLA